MSFKKLFCLIGMIVTFTVTLAIAQKKSPSETRVQTPAKPSTNRVKSRARRTVPAETQQTELTSSISEAEAANDPTTESSPAAVMRSAEPTQAQTGSSEKPAEPPTDTQSKKASTEAETANASDPVLELKEQINAAQSPEERLRLQLSLANQLADTGKTSEALNELHSLTSVDVFDPQTFYNAGNSFARLRDTEGAIKAYRKAIEQRKGNYSRALNNLGVVFLRVGRWDEAYEALLAALKIESFRYAEASYNLGRLYVARGQMNLANRELRRALSVDPDHKYAAQLLMATRNDELITVERPSKLAKETNSRPASASSTTAEKQPTKGSTHNSPKPLTLDPVSYELLQKARGASERGKKLEAIENYRRLIARQAGYFGPANLELSYQLISLQRNDEAITALLQVANRDSLRYPITYYHLARLYEARGDLKLAEEAFAQATAAYGDQNSQFLLDLSRVREKQGNFKGALEALQLFIDRRKKDGEPPNWSEERLTALRQKLDTQPPK